MLLHLKVEWPKLRGQAVKERAVADLKKVHAASHFKESFACLPQAFKDHIAAFA